MDSEPWGCSSRVWMSVWGEAWQKWAQSWFPWCGEVGFGWGRQGSFRGTYLRGLCGAGPVGRRFWFWWRRTLWLTFTRGVLTTGKGCVRLKGCEDFCRCSPESKWNTRRRVFWLSVARRFSAPGLDSQGSVLGFQRGHLQAEFIHADKLASPGKGVDCQILWQTWDHQLLNSGD